MLVRMEYVENCQMNRFALSFDQCYSFLTAEKPIDVVLPTGAMGNIAGGYIAKKMGLPIRFLCAGVNVNDITHRAIQQGQFHKSDGMIKTLSDAINIQLVCRSKSLLI